MSMINNWAMSTVQRNTAVEVVKECIKKIGPAKNEANIIKNKWNEISQNLIGMIKVNRICPVASYTGLKKHFTLKLTQVLNIHIPISKFSADLVCTTISLKSQTVCLPQAVWIVRSL